MSENPLINAIELKRLTAEYGADKAREIMRERAAADRLRAAIAIVESDLGWYWHWGDGEGGYVLDLLSDAVRKAGYSWPHDPKAPRYQPKAKIGRKLSKRVMERDKFRCVNCGTHVDLCCDHIMPESKGGPTTFENLQTMCRPCNSRKGNRT